MTSPSQGTDLPETMRAVVYTDHEGPEAVTVEDRPVPRPGPGEVLVKVAAAGMNGADVSQRRGVYDPPPGVTDVPGLELSGTVAALGEDDDDAATAGWIAPGTPVCALLAGGAHAEYAVVPVPQLLPVPEGMDLVTAAGLPEVACTVWFNVMMRSQARAGETVLVHGASGGIGSHAVQLLHARGHRVLGTAGGPEKVERALGLGADAVFDHRSAELGAFADWVAEQTDGAGVDVILDVVGAAYLEANLRSLARDGRLAVIALQKGRRAEIDLGRLMARGLKVGGSTLRARPVEEKAEIVEQVVREVWPLVEQGRIDPCISARFGLEEAAQAHRAFEDPARTGKVLLVMGEGR